MIFSPPEDLHIDYNQPDYNTSFWNDKTHGIFYGDASGGKFSSMTPLRRIGCGVCQINSDNSRLWGHSFNLPGTVQSVPRGELFAIVYLLQRVSPLSQIEFVTDNLKVHDTYHKGREYAQKSVNSDLYEELFDLIDHHLIRFSLRWMPSHLKPEDPRPDGVTEADIVGNSFADILAGDAAVRHQVPLNVSTPYIYYFSLVRKIQRRLIQIVTHIPSRGSVPKRSNVILFRPKTDYEALIAASDHAAFFCHGHIKCAQCEHVLPARGQTTIEWLSTSCNPEPFSLDRPIKLRNEIIIIKNRTTHPSHDLRMFKKLIYCKKCGYTARGRLQGLFGACDTPKQYGSSILKSISKGQLPPFSNLADLRL